MNPIIDPDPEMLPPPIEPVYKLKHHDPPVTEISVPNNGLWVSVIKGPFIHTVHLGTHQKCGPDTVKLLNLAYAAGFRAGRKSSPRTWTSQDGGTFLETDEVRPVRVGDWIMLGNGIVRVVHLGPVNPSRRIWKRVESESPARTESSAPEPGVHRDSEGTDTSAGQGT